MTFIWSRAASFTYCGLRNGYGYRDTVQDIQGVIHLAPEMAVEKIRFMLSAQVDNGGDFRLSSLHTIRDMRILLTTLPMYRRQDTRLIELMMHYGFSQLYTNMYQRQEM